MAKRYIYYKNLQDNQKYWCEFSGTDSELDLLIDTQRNKFKVLNIMNHR